ncbi:hypothetical protein H6G50_05195 [Oscillatoria sp. FACHB-1406]|nr:hypothetical protein [Oscillatoria sp. FACHB-1406]
MLTLKKEPSLISSELLLSLAAAPFLLSVVTIKTLTQRLQEIGQASEEIFRGDRLPVLNFPESGSDR